MEFIHFLAEEYSKHDLTVETDRCVAISGLETRIARARRCQSIYGIFQSYLHRNLLWQRSDETKAKRIGYENEIVPSWSWMIYNRGIHFIDIPFGDVRWNKRLRLKKKHRFVWLHKKGKHALITDVGAFQNCTLEQQDKSYAILDSSKNERGRIQYDLGVIEDIHAERCVVVGKESYRDEPRLGNKEKYYILVVRPTSAGGEYRRVGVGCIESDYVVRQRLNVRVV